MASVRSEKVLSVEHWSDTLFSFTTTRDPSFRFESGHFVMLGIDLGGKKLMRAYSIASPHYDDKLEFLSIKVPDGALTSKLQLIQPGQEVLVSDKPVGTLVVRDLKPAKNLYLFSTGTGLAPFMSMIETLRARGQERDVVLLHGVSYDYDLAWREMLTDLEASGGFPIRYVGTISRPQHCPGWTGCTGRAEAVFERQLDEHGLTPENATIYLCGNPDMITAIEEIAAGRGFAPEQVRKELYWPKGRTH